MEQAIKILIADENADFRLGCRDGIMKQGFNEIEVATNGADADNKIRLFRPDVVILDRPYR